MVKLSVLDYALIDEGKDAQKALQDSVTLAKLADRLGFKRIWFTEHHNVPAFACSSPELLMMHTLAQTNHIRVGSGGVMLPHYRPYKIAEHFRMMAALYPKVRMYYERSEPVAEAFGDLDPKIDARLADMKEEKKEKEWSGYHKIEKALYEDQKIDDVTKKDAQQLLKDAKELHAKADTLDITPKLMLQGSVDLLNEVATSKITGEEEIYSHTDLYDFKANVEGAQKIYDLFKPILEKKDKKLSDDIQMNFDKVNQLLDKYKDNNGGYESFEKVSKKDRKAFADAVNALGEPLSKMAVITE